MSTTSNDFLSVAGILEFDPEEREANGKTVHQFRVKGPGQKDIRVTVWPELKFPTGSLKKGLLVGVRGKYSTSTGQDGTEYHNLSATSLSIGSDVYLKDAAPVVQKASAAEPAF